MDIIQKEKVSSEKMSQEYNNIQLSFPLSFILIIAWFIPLERHLIIKMS